MFHPSLSNAAKAFQIVVLFGLLSRDLLAVPMAANLAGPWRIALDARDRGRDERWFERDFAQSITLPGSVQATRLGDPITTETKWTGSIFDKSWFTAPEYATYRKPGNIKVPFWLQPETHFTGAAWYQRAIEVPVLWAAKRVTLLLERPHWKTTVWLDAREIGSNDSLSVPHLYELGSNLAPGQHRLTIRVDNSLDPDIGENSHSVSDHTQGNWNGIVGRIELTATASEWIDDLQVYPRLSDRSIQVRGRVSRIGDQPFPAHVRIRVDNGNRAKEAVVTSDGRFATTLTLAPDAALWDEFHPNLHHLTAVLSNGERCSVSFGLREIRSDGRQLRINGRPLFLRGTLDCAAYPRTGHPPMEVATWKKVMGTIKAHGLNHIRFHSWCPPEEAFEAADQLGMYLQIEAASWPNWSTTLGDGKPVDAWIDAETSRILRTYGNHPSFVMFSCCNEPGGDRSTPWLAGWVARHKAENSRHLFTAGSGWPEVPQNDYDVTPQPRIQHWGEGLGSRINARPPETVTDYGDFIRERNVPVVSHEIGQWCAYPNFAEMPKYTGYLKPRNFEIFRDSLEAHGLGAQAHDFLIASGKLQALCYKEDIESALRTPQMGGFQLLGLSDFPGQGTALVGVLDAFWEEKGYITAAEFARFCGPTVPLARLEKRVFTADEHFVADVEVAHYGPAQFAAATASWKLVADDGSVAAGGDFVPRTLEVGARNELGRIDVALSGVATPARYKLVVTVHPEAGKAGFANDWDMWVYPPVAKVKVQPTPEVMVASSFDEAVRAKLETGARVVLMIPPQRVAPDPQRGPIALGFSSIFWNTAWTHGQAPHTLGILCDPKSSALAEFPTDAWSNWQWWYPVTHASPMILDGLPRELKPIVQVIDDWMTNRKLALVFEARFGTGRLLVTSINLADAALDPVRRQLRASLLAYVASSRFQPSVVVRSDQVETLFAR